MLMMMGALMSYCLSLIILLGLSYKGMLEFSFHFLMLTVNFLSVVLLLTSESLLLDVLCFMTGGSTGALSLTQGVKSKGLSSCFKVLVVSLMVDVLLVVFFVFLYLYGYNLFTHYSLFLVFIVLLKSCFFLFGFWMYEAMDAPYFISCFLHSSGVVLVGIIILFKLSLYISNEGLLMMLVLGILGIFFNLVLFFFTTDIKKLLGSLTCISYNVMLILFMLDFSVGAFYFLIHLLLKGGLFYMLMCMLEAGLESGSFMFNVFLCLLYFVLLCLMFVIGDIFFNLYLCLKIIMVLESMCYFKVTSNLLDMNIYACSESFLGDFFGVGFIFFILNAFVMVFFMFEFVLSFLGLNSISFVGQMGFKSFDNFVFEMILSVYYFFFNNLKTMEEEIYGLSSNSFKFGNKGDFIFILALVVLLLFIF